MKLRTEISTLLATDVEKRAEDFGEKVGKLTKDMQALEIELRAAVVIDGTDAEPVETRSEGDAEEREKRQLLGKVSLGNYIKAAVSGKTLSGAEAEASEAFGCAGMVPLEVFDTLRETRSEDHGNLETRAITPSPADQRGEHSRRWFLRCSINPWPHGWALKCQRCKQAFQGIRWCPQT